MNHKSGPHRRAEAHIREIDDTAAKRYKIYYYYESDAWEL